VKEIIISANEAGQRLDKFLLKYLNKAPASFVHKMLRKKNIKINDKKADAAQKLNLNDSVKIFLADDTLNNFREDNFIVPPIFKEDPDIVYEDKNIILVNKKAGVLSQKAKEDDISMNEYIISYLLKNKKITLEELKTFKPSICNRLDRNTSGMIVIGVSLIGLQTMSLLFKERDIDKYYLTIVKGELYNKEKVKGYLSKDSKINKVIIKDSVSENEMEDYSYIETEYEPVKNFELENMKLCLLKVKLITGKTHQIRAHLSYLNHPIIGDTKYGDESLNKFFKDNFRLRGQLLHSYKLNFDKVNGELSYLNGKEFVAKPPVLFNKIIGDKNGNMEF